MTYEVSEMLPVPIRVPKPLAPKIKKPKGIKVTKSLKAAAKAYKDAYYDVYHVRIKLTYDGTWVRLQGAATGVSVKRLREMTSQLRHRAG